MGEQGDEVEVIMIVGEDVTVRPTEVNGRKVQFCEVVSKACLSPLTINRKSECVCGTIREDFSSKRLYAAHPETCAYCCKLKELRQQIVVAEKQEEDRRVEREARNAIKHRHG